MPRGDLIKIRRGTAAQWAAVNPILAEGELGLETDTGKIKGGNGADAWISLPYSGSGGGGGGNSWGSITGTLSSQTDLQSALDAKASTSALATKADASAVSSALDGKQDTLVSGTNIKTVNGETLIGSGNIAVGGSNNLDGGSAASTYGGANVINGGGASG